MERDGSILIEKTQISLNEKKTKDFTDFYENIISDISSFESTNLIDKIIVNSKLFAKEEQQLNYFNDHILPDLSDFIKGKDLRIWCAGCSEGEEAYNISMMIEDFLGKSKITFETKILATDISANILETASSGVFKNSRLESLSKDWQEKYFKRINKEYSVLCDKIRDRIIFRRFNLMEERFPFKRKFQVIFCRNLLVYFDNNTRIEMINKFYQLTEPGGYLFIDDSDRFMCEIHGYRNVMPSIYKK